MGNFVLGELARNAIVVESTGNGVEWYTEDGRYDVGYEVW